MRFFSLLRRLFPNRLSMPTPTAPVLHSLCEQAGECYAQLEATYEQVVAALAKVRPLDAGELCGWAFQDEEGRKGCLWAQQINGGRLRTCTRWMVAGNSSLLTGLFR